MTFGYYLGSIKIQNLIMFYLDNPILFLHSFLIVSMLNHVLRQDANEEELAFIALYYTFIFLFLVVFFFVGLLYILFDVIFNAVFFIYFFYFGIFIFFKSFRFSFIFFFLEYMLLFSKKLEN